jgi:energy-coupling factor transporter ATP-binding protein EcfA2
MTERQTPIIIIQGPTGCGKSALAKKLSEALVKLGIEVDVVGSADYDPEKAAGDTTGLINKTVPLVIEDTTNYILNSPRFVVETQPAGSCHKFRVADTKRTFMGMTQSAGYFETKEKAEARAAALNITGRSDDKYAWGLVELGELFDVGNGVLESHKYTAEQKLSVKPSACEK